MSARYCASCGKELIRRRNEYGNAWASRLTCGPACANARRSLMLAERLVREAEQIDDAEGWPVANRLFRWPDGIRFEDSPAALRDIGSRERLGLLPSRISGCGNAASMCIDRGEGYGGRVGRAS